MSAKETTGADPTLFNEFVQENDISTSTSTTAVAYQPVDVRLPGAPDVYFQGLKRGCGLTPPAFADGNMPNCYWYYAIGSYAVWGTGTAGIPYHSGLGTTWVQLYVSIGGMLQCPAGRFSLANATTCSACPAGSHCSAGSPFLSLFRNPYISRYCTHRHGESMHEPP